MNEAAVILAIETSCDETAAAVVERGRIVRSSVVASQIAMHAPFGGVVPEIASRAHVEVLPDVLERTLLEAGVELGDVDAVAACHGPGLAGALLVGVSAAKALALVSSKPYIGVHHHEGHLYAALLADAELQPPFVTLIVSGGHTLLVAVRRLGSYELLGQTVDDAAGEAFDKVARFIGLGFPGGPAIERIARRGDAAAITFPRPMLRDGYDMSFAGLKTAVVRWCQANPDFNAADVAASFQAAVVEVLVTKAMRAAVELDVATVVVGGGVAANSVLRSELECAAADLGLRAVVPDLELCTDNAAMIGAAAYFRLASDGPSPLTSGVTPNLQLPSSGVG